jgi:hypothetical protein
MAWPSVTVAVMEQKSAEAIVGKDSTTYAGVVAGNKPGIVTESREDLPCRRAELEEWDVILYELPMHNEPDRVSAWSASWEFSPQDNHRYCRHFKEPGLSVTGYVPSFFGNPPVPTRMPGVGRGAPAYPIMAWSVGEYFHNSY